MEYIVFPPSRSVFPTILQGLDNPLILSRTTIGTVADPHR